MKGGLGSGRVPLGLEGSSIDDYNRQESSEMQDIQSLANSQQKAAVGSQSQREQE